MPRPPLRPRRRVRRRTAALAGAILVVMGLSGGLVEAPASASNVQHPQWSAEEEQFVYELNRARWDPSVVLAAAGLEGGSVLPAPPLAVSDLLASAAQYRSDEMIDFDYFAHQSPVTGSWPNAVVREFGYPLPDFWPDGANSVESIHRGSPRVSGVLQSFVDSVSHRPHLMGQGGFTLHGEIGVGARLEERIWTVLSATTGSGDLFLTGVAYADADGNGRMDLGEGLPGVTVAIEGASTITNAGGGWALPAAPGPHRVTASGGGFVGESTVRVRVRRYNVEVDFVSPPSGVRSLGRPQVFSYETCFGRSPTILGTSGNDVIVGTPGDDVIVGGGGNDLIRGGGGNDLICGGGGRDRIFGGPGRDLISGGAGRRDRCVGGERLRACER